MMVGGKGVWGRGECAGQGRRCVWEMQWMLVGSGSSCRVHIIAEEPKKHRAKNFNSTWESVIVPSM